jgi:hypothetical protein
MNETHAGSALLPWHHLLVAVIVGLAIAAVVIGLDSSWTFVV